MSNIPTTIGLGTAQRMGDATRLIETTGSNTVAKTQRLLNLIPNSVSIQNTSGSDIPPFGVLGIGGVNGTPSGAPPITSEPFPGGTIVLQGVAVTQDYCGRVAICPQGIKASAIGQCVISGVCWAYVYMSNQYDLQCDACDGTSTYLLSRTAGSIDILAFATGTGAQWVPVRFGPDRPFPAEVTGNSQIGSNPAWKYSFSEVFKNATGQGGWSVLTNGRTGTTSSKSAFNMIEDMNESGYAGTFGMGVKQINLPTKTSTSLQPQPIPTGAIVWMQKVYANGGIENQIMFESAIDGGCS